MDVQNDDVLMQEPDNPSSEPENPPPEPDNPPPEPDNPPPEPENPPPEPENPPPESEISPQELKEEKKCTQMITKKKHIAMFKKLKPILFDEYFCYLRNWKNYKGSLFQEIYNATFVFKSNTRPDEYSYTRCLLLYQVVKGWLLQQIKIHKDMLEKEKEKEDEFFLQQYIKRWNIFRDEFEKLSFCLSHVENNLMMYAKQENSLSFFFSESNMIKTYYTGKIMPIYDTGIDIWKTYVFSKKCKATFSKILIYYDEMRQGNPGDEVLLKGFLSYIDTFDNRKEKFQKIFLENTRKYYAKKCDFPDDLSCFDIVKKVYDLRSREVSLCNKFFNSTTIRENMGIFDSIFFYALGNDGGVYESILKNTIFEFTQFHVEYCNYVFQFTRYIIDAKKRIILFVKNMLIQKGKELCGIDESSETPMNIIGDGDLIKTIIKFVGDIYCSLECKFCNDSDYKSSFDQGIRFILNKYENAGLLLANYCDDILRKNGPIKIDECERILKLKDIMTVVELLNDKYQFIHFGKRKGLNRYLQTNTFSDSLEDHWVKIIKESFGLSEVRYFKSIHEENSSSKDFTKEFSACPSNLYPDFLSIMILPFGIFDLKCDSTDRWNMPSKIIANMVCFEKFYTGKKHPNRNLKWSFVNSTFDVKVHIPAGNGKHASYVFKCTHEQMLVLMQFENMRSKWTLEELKERTKLPASVIQEVIVVLKQKLRLIASTKENYFTIYPKFTSKILHINLTSFSKTKMNEKKISATAHVHDRELNAKREQIVQAAIIRIMKASKMISFERLRAGIVEQLCHNFQPNVSFIQSTISKLIEKEYMEKVLSDDGNSSNELTYRYIES